MVPEVNVTINTKSRKSINVNDTIVYILMGPSLQQKNNPRTFLVFIRMNKVAQIGVFTDKRLDIT